MTDGYFTGNVVADVLLGIPLSTPWQWLAVIGPRLVNLSTGRSKEFALTESARFKIGASFTNALNHPNLADDSGHFHLDIGSAGFGQISASRSLEA
jgi:hypothetical protein